MQSESDSAGRVFSYLSDEEPVSLGAGDSVRSHKEGLSGLPLFLVLATGAYTCVQRYISEIQGSVED